MAPAGAAAVSVTRYSPDVRAGQAHVAKMVAEDAFVVLYQLQTHPSHEFKLDGRLQTPEAAPQGELNIVDLRMGDACGRLLHPADTLMFHVPFRAIEHILEESGAATVAPMRAPQPWRTVDPVVRQLAPLLVEALAASGDKTDQLLHEHLLYGLGAHFVQRYGGWRRRDPQLGGLAAWQERRAKEMLDDAATRHFSIRAIARECGLSPDHFTRAFKASVGMAPSAWLQARRMDRAKQLLETSRLSLAEIAQICGFADQSHFSRQFSRTVGESPSRWRRRF